MAKSAPINLYNLEMLMPKSLMYCQTFLTGIVIEFQKIQAILVKLTVTRMHEWI